jgi:mono/diheme cytochrome c family protein
VIEERYKSPAVRDSRAFARQRPSIDSQGGQVNAKRVVFGCLIVGMSVCTWAIGRAAEEPGQGVFEANCKRCHGPEGRGIAGQGPNLIPFYWTNEQALELIRHPLCDMPPFPEEKLSDAQIAQIVAYLRTIKE